MTTNNPTSPREALERLVDAVIDRAEQACRYALKHQEFEDTNGGPNARRDAWEDAAEVCEKAINPHVRRHAQLAIDEALSALSIPPVKAASPEGEEDKGNHDCLAKRRPGEPMFIILGRDPDGANTVRGWASRRLAAGGDPEHCQQGFVTADRMKTYAADPANKPASAPPVEAYAHPSEQSRGEGVITEAMVERAAAQIMGGSRFSQEDRLDMARAALTAALATPGED